MNDHSNIPSLEARETPEFTTCPFCTMQMPSDAPVCPHCNSKNPTAPDFREMLAAPERHPKLKSFVRLNWQYIATGGAIAIAFLVTAIVYYGWLWHRVDVTENPDFKVKVEQGVENGRVIIEGTVKNLGEDIPDLSLKSIRVIATFGLEGGGQHVETVFPKNPHRGEGSLLRGESGYFRVDIAEEKVVDASLTVEVMDLTGGQPRQKGVISPIIRTK